MGTIAEKIEYLDQTRELLKDNINKVNNVLTDESTFRSYPQELFNGYLDILNNGTDTLWSNLEKVSQTGTEAVLENVETAPMKIELSGNTSQDTTEGYNILPNRLTQGTSKGITYQKKSDGSVVLNGTSTGTVDLYVFENWNSDANTIVLSPQKYVLGIKYTEDEVNKNVKLFIVKDKTTAIDNTSSRKILNIEQETTVTSLLLRVENETTLNNYVVYPILYKGEDLTTPYEPYTNGASPNPDFPQEVKVVTGENVVSVQGKNFLDLNNPMYTKTPLQSDGVAFGTSTVSNISQYIKVKENTKYTLSLTNDNYSRRIAFYSNPLEKEVTSEKVISVIEYRGNTTTFTTPNNCKYIRFAYFDVADNVQLEQGTATDYQPYSKTDYPITLSAENHFKGEFRRGGAVSTTITTRLFSDDNYSMEAGKQYVFETNLDMTQFNFAINISTREFPTTAMFDTGWLSSNKYVFTCAMDGHLGVPIRKKDDSIIALDDIEDVWFKLYEPIVETEETLELCKIKTYKDYFHKDSGKWHVHKEIKKIVLDGTRNWIYQDESTTPTPRTVIRLQNAGLGSNLYFSSHIIKDSPSSNRIVFLTDGGGTIYLSLDNTLTGIDINDDSSSKVSKIKTWLSNNNVTLYYVPATPVEEEITNATLIEQLEAISKAKSVKEKTYVTQINDELPFVLDVEAIKKYEVA